MSTSSPSGFARAARGSFAAIAAAAILFTPLAPAFADASTTSPTVATTTATTTDSNTGGTNTHTDTTPPPVITLNGDATVNLTVGATWTDPGATATDDTDGDLTSKIVVGGDKVDPSTPGTYVITYDVSDSAGNNATEVKRTVIVASASGTDGDTGSSITTGSIGSLKTESFLSRPPSSGPSFSNTSPSNGDKISGTNYTVSADVSDSNTVTDVTYSVDANYGYPFPIGHETVVSNKPLTPITGDTYQATLDTTSLPTTITPHGFPFPLPVLYYTFTFNASDSKGKSKTDTVNFVKIGLSAPPQDADTTPPSTPVATPPGGSFDPGTIADLNAGVALSSTDDSGATPSIYYTLDGSTPSNTNGTLYSAPVDISTALTANGTETIEAVAYDGSGNESGVMTDTYTYSAGGSTPTLPTIHACDDSEAGSFDAYVDGTVNGQNGWSATNQDYDEAVVDNIYGINSFGCKVLRVSDAVTSGSFSDWVLSPTTAPAGESSVASDNHFDAQFDIAAASTTATGASLSVAPTDANGDRMSYLRFEDEADGIHVYFDDVTDAGPLGTAATFNQSQIALLDRTVPHTIGFSIDFADGAANDTVKISIDGSVVKTGGSWEDYYRYDPEQAVNGNTLHAIDRLIIQARGTANPTDLGYGFLFDNVSASSSEVSAAPVPSVTTDPATNLTVSDATLNGTNGPIAADHESFWVSTSTIVTTSSLIPAGVYSTPTLSSIAAGASFSDPLSLVTTQGITNGQVAGNMPAITPGTTYYYVAWAHINGTWYPGAVQSFTTASAPGLAPPTNLYFTQGTTTLACGATTSSNASVTLHWTPSAGTFYQYFITPTYPDGKGEYTYYPPGTATSVWIGDNFANPAQYHGEGVYSYVMTAQNVVHGPQSAPTPACTLTYVAPDTQPPTVTVTPGATVLHGVETFDITVNDNEPLDPTKNKSVWVYLYDNHGTQKLQGANVDLSSGHGTFSVDTTKLDDGAVTLDVGVVKDAAGNPTQDQYHPTGSDSYFTGYTVDNTGPIVTVTPLATDGVLSGTVTFTITLNDANPATTTNKAIWTYLYNNQPPQAKQGAKIDLSSGVGTFTVDTTKLANGTSTLDVERLEDAVGNWSGNGDNYFKNYVIDNDATPPSIPVASPDAGAYKTSQSVTLSSTDDSGVTPSIYYTTDGTTPSKDNGTLYSGAITVSSSETIEAVAYDGSGNESGVGTFAYVIDTTRPTLVFNEPAIASTTATSTLPVSVTATDGGSGLTSLIVHVYNAAGTFLGSCGSGDNALAGASSDTYTCTLDTSAYPDGDYSLRAGTNDVAGNNQTVSLPFIVQKSPPAAPTALTAKFQYDSADIANGATLNKTASTTGNNLELLWAAPSGAVTGYHILVTYPDGTTGLSYQGPNTNAWLALYDGFGAHGQGEYDYQVVAVNGNGVSSPSETFALSYDTQSPTAYFTATPPAFVNGNFQVQGAASDTAYLNSAFFDVRDPSDTTGNSWRAGCIASTTVLTYSVDHKSATLSCEINTSNLIEGHTYTLRIHAGDKAGYGGGSQQSLVLDTTRPNATITAPADGTTLNTSDLTITGTATDNLSGINHVTIYVSKVVPPDPITGKTFGGYVVDDQPAVWDAGAGTFTYDAAGLADGQYIVKADVFDGAGNDHFASPSPTITIDTTAPAIPTLVSPADGASVNGASVTQSWSDSDPSVDHYVYQSFNDAAATSLRFQGTYTNTSKTATNVADSTYYWRVAAVDAAGNQSAWSPLWKLTIDNGTGSGHPIDTAPVASDQSVSVNEGSSIDLVLAATDADGDTLSYATTSPPTNGTLTGTAPNLTYTPNANFNGTDSFTFTANDGTDTSNIATVNITVNPVVIRNAQLFFTGGTSGQIVSNGNSGGSGDNGQKVLGASTYNFTRDLFLGSTGDDVTALQQFLIQNGYSIPAGATGYFGFQTQAALAKFQSDNHITPAVGYFGPITRALVNQGTIETTPVDSGTNASIQSEIKNLLAQLAALQAEIASSTASTTNS